MTLQRQERLKKLQMDQSAISQEEAFFQKWLKQRENLGSEKPDTFSQREGAPQKAPGSVKKAKDATGKELDAINKQLRKDNIMKNYSVEKRAVRKQVNVNSITAETIRAFIEYLDVTEADTEFDTNKKLNQAATLDHRKTVSKSNYNTDGTMKSIPEEDLNDRMQSTTKK
jgi:hypothetical protein